MRKLFFIIIEIILCLVTIVASNSILLHENPNVEFNKSSTNSTIEIHNNDDVDCLEILTNSPVSLSYVNNLYLTQFYSTHYFNNLNIYYGKNYKGSCSYVSLAMLLSFYDTYWDDAIIDEHYDQSTNLIISTPYLTALSPGIKSDADLPYNEERALGIYGIRKLTYSEYFEVVNDNADDYFHLKLISMGRVPSIYKLYQFFDQNPYGLGLNGRIALLETYLYDYMNFSEDEISYEYVTTDVENYIINKVSQGIPVLTAVGFPDGTGHAFIVYDYDDVSGTLYGHVGWESWETHVDISTLNFSYFKNAMTLQINNEHNCSNNFISSDGTTYCSCYFSCHPEHEHIYESVNNTYHTYSCQCEPQGAQIEHDMYLSMSVGTNQHGYKCCDCGYIDEDTVEEHSFDFWVFISDTRHIEQCGCGVRGSVTAPHVFRMTDSPLEPKICMGCGYTKFPGGGGNVIMSTEQVSINGSYKMPDGTIYLVDADIEAYLNGTLVFYDKDKVPVTQ